MKQIFLFTLWIFFLMGCGDADKGKKTAAATTDGNKTTGKKIYDARAQNGLSNHDGKLGSILGSHAQCTK